MHIRSLGRSLCHGAVVGYVSPLWDRLDPDQLADHQQAHVIVRRVSLPDFPEVGLATPGTAAAEKIVQERVAMIELQKVSRDVCSRTAAEIAFADQD